MERPIISIKEARKILGDEAKNMSDKEIADMLETMDVLAKDALTLAREKINEDKK